MDVLHHWKVDELNGRFSSKAMLHYRVSLMTTRPIPKLSSKTTELCLAFLPGSGWKMKFIENGPLTNELKEHVTSWYIFWLKGWFFMANCELTRGSSLLLPTTFTMLAPGTKTMRSHVPLIPIPHLVPVCSLSGGSAHSQKSLSRSMIIPIRTWKTSLKRPTPCQYLS